MADFKWNVTNGVMNVEDTASGERESFSIANYPDSIKDSIRDFGFKSLFQARASQVPTEEKMEYWRDLDAMFAEGTWEKDRVRGAIVVAAWVEVLAEKKGCATGDLQKALAAYSKEQRAKIKANVEAMYADDIAAIAAQRKAADVSLDDLI